MKVAGAVKQEWRAKICLVFAIELLDEPSRGRKTQLQSPCARVNHRKTERPVRPRVIQVQMKSAADQKLIVRLPKKLGVASFGDAQIFLGLFVIGIEAQRFTELNNGLRDLTLGQVKPAQTIVSNR